MANCLVDTGDLVRILLTLCNNSYHSLSRGSENMPTILAFKYHSLAAPSPALFYGALCDIA